MFETLAGLIDVDRYPLDACAATPLYSRIFIDSTKVPFRCWMPM